ncbi:MAG: alpha/beta hydrolase fold domain-containing protein [Oscillospiraceae bacterium]|nr:alpha/beta hydrolase fold domain-containing protein [Oscillospiraceae bacterium]
MSLMHSILFRSLMKNRKYYDPNVPKDYPAERRKEIKSTAMVKIPKGVTLRGGTLGGVDVEWITGENNPTDRIVLYIHGGGFVTGSSAARGGFTSYVAHTLGLNVVSVDYRLAPEHPFPAGPHDCLAAYEALLAQYPSDRIVFLGESAGGNLVLSLLLQAKEKGLPLPAAVFSLSPTVQYDRELPSYRNNEATDCILTNFIDEARDVYLCSRDDAVLKDPVAAPLYGDYTGCPPIILWVSNSEILLDDSLLLYEKLQEQGVTVKLYRRPGMMHTWLIVPQLSEAKTDLETLGKDMNLALDSAYLSVSTGEYRFED